ncbi:hypothetical protein [Oceaniglobus ichthyenteri]|uniref:hypothetical protein n=1 Tax=Oceaniglobus ichthyenteri TaxID=2136177 RepID=UPI000D34600D|nr:hypothetical protein [Oceaniglobus ichthyenteri]
MHADLETRRRVLIVMYRRYLDADRCWNLAVREMKLWFPTEDQHSLSRLGNPGSFIRRRYEQRERALALLTAAHLKLDVARQRLAKRRAKSDAAPPLRLTYIGAHVA